MAERNITGPTNVPINVGGTMDITMRAPRGQRSIEVVVYNYFGVVEVPPNSTVNWEVPPNSRETGRSADIVVDNYFGTVKVSPNSTRVNREVPPNSRETGRAPQVVMDNVFGTVKLPPSRVAIYNMIDYERIDLASTALMIAMGLQAVIYLGEIDISASTADFEAIMVALMVVKLLITPSSS